MCVCSRVCVCNCVNVLTLVSIQKPLEVRSRVCENLKPGRFLEMKMKIRTQKPVCKKIWKEDAGMLSINKKKKETEQRSQIRCYL